jgi:hypothetical protein
VPDSGSPDWLAVCETVARAVGTETRAILAALQETAQAAQTLLHEMNAMGVDEDVIAFLRPVIEQNLRTLNRL